MANIDYNEILLNAIDAVVVSRIADVNFDRTVTCTIVDATNADSGIYTVNDGSVEFTAESENSKYRKNDCVNVLIPGNDYSNTKTILGKVSKDKDQRPITYVPPTDKIVPMSDNLAVLSTQKSLIANGAVQEIELTTHNISTDTLPTINFDTLCVSADFKTLMGDYDMRDGNFGLRVDLITDKNNIYTLLLDSKKDMFGNPYAYSSYFNQEQTYHLNLEENIVRIKTYLYQLGNFKYNDGINAGLANLEPANYNNIFINNVLVTFGYNAEQIEDNTVKIDTPSDKTYNNITNEGLGKKLILTWFNKDENNEYIGFTDGNFGSEEDAKTANKNTYYIKWEHSKNNGSWEPINNAANLSSFELEVDPTKSINDYRAYVIFNGSSYMSNTISFRAETGYDSNIKEQLNMALTIEHGENSLDSYPLYGPDSALVNTGESSKPREVYFSYKSSVGGTLEPDILNGATAYLYIPTISTMLEQPYDGWSRKVGENDAANIEGYAAYCKTYIDEFSAQDGENLLRNTAPYELAGAGMGYDYEKQISEWSGNKSVFARATDGGKKTVMLKNTSSSEQVMSAEQKITLKSNTTYTISGSIYPTSAIEPKFILGYSDSNKIETAIEPYANDGTWKHFSITFTTGVVEEKVSIGFSAKIKSKKYVLWYKLMLVEGVKAKEWSYGAGEAEKIKNRAKTFRYRIKDIYNPLFANNEILLKIVDKNGYKYSTTKQFGFSSHGTSGTDYSLIIEDPINKKATLYDANYKPIKTEFADNDWSYWPKPLGQNETRTAAAGYLVRKLTTKVNWVGGDVNLEALKGVSWAPEDSNYYYQGPTTIVYDSNGVNPKYYNGDIGLFDKNTNQLVEGITWALRYYTADKLNKDPLATISINGYPELTQVDSGSLPRLKASNMYLTPSNGNEYYLVLVGIKDSNVMWRQPLIITQNQYASSVLNNWDGSLVINQEENTVLTAMVGAGSKNADNEFSGVVMGEFSKLEGDKSIPQSSGLLGFHNGVQSFGFKTNGTAFIGKSGTGRINFDGAQGIIASNNWIDSSGEILDELPFIEGSNDTQRKPGLKINLKDGHLNMSATNGNYFSFNDNGLDIKANQLTITGGLGGINLLLNTEPIELYGFTQSTQSDSIKYWYPGNDNTTVVAGTTSGRKKAVYASSNGKLAVYQNNISFEQNKYYTISGEIYSNDAQIDYTIDLYDNDGVNLIQNIGNGSCPAGQVSPWHRFSFTFKSEQKIIGSIYFSHAKDSGYTRLYHWKLEEGSTATQWSAAPSDAEYRTQFLENIIGDDLEALDKSFDQQEVFNRLTNNHTKNGIYLDGENLYIDARRIATGAIASQNWLDKNTGGGIISDSGEIINPGSQGMAISLSNGQIDANHFRFNSNSIYLNSNPNNNEYYIAIGSDIDNPNFSFSKDKKLKIIANEFSLTTHAIGGDNILRNTNQPKEQSWHGWPNSKFTVSYEEDSIESIITTTAYTGSHFLRYLISKEDLQLLKENEKYTLSFDIKPSINTTITGYLGPDDSGKFGGPYTTESSQKLQKDIWNKVIFVLTRNTAAISTSTDAQGIKFNFSPLAQGSFSIKNLKLEQGTNATGWNPHPEENITASEFTIAKNNISAKVSKTGTGTNDGCSWRLTENGFYVNKGSATANSNNYVLKVDGAGLYINGNGSFTGAITATSLTLSGATILYDSISGTPNLTVYIAKDGTVGSTPVEGATGFKVSNAGKLEAANAIIYGELYSSVGKIGGWTLGNNILKNSGETIWLTPEGKSGTVNNTTKNFSIFVNNNFGVTKEGNLHTKGATIDGDIDSSGSMRFGFMYLSKSGLMVSGTNTLPIDVLSWTSIGSSGHINLKVHNCALGISGTGSLFSIVCDSEGSQGYFNGPVHCRDATNFTFSMSNNTFSLADIWARVSGINP